MPHTRTQIPFFHPRRRPRRLLASSKLALRLRILDRRLDLQRGHGFTEVIMGDAMADIIRGDTSCILEGWDFSDTASVSRSIKTLGLRWAKEDAARRA